jgi:thiosulfate dehydrogenase [quinone] large subunit
MNKITVSAVALRLLLGWYMFYDGIVKVINPAWSASSFLLGAKTFPAFYAWFAQPMNSWWVNPLNAWGITLIGAALILGIGIRPAAWAGAALMILYYFPHYTLPYVTDGGFIVEDHLIFAAAFILIALLPAAQRFSLAGAMRRTFLGRIPVVKSLV